MTPLRTRLAAATVGAGLVLAAPAAAWAIPHRSGGERTETTESTTVTTVPSTTSSSAPAGRDLPGRDLETLRSRCLAAIDTRLPALSKVKAVLAAAKRVTDDHRADLTAMLDDAADQLQALREEIADDTEVSDLREHCRSIFEDNRVFALVLPRTRLVVASDMAGAVAGKLDELTGKLSAAIAEAEAAGRDVTQAKADLVAMKAKIASGRSSAASVADAVLELTPDDWNANHDVLAPARRSLESARSDLREARKLAGKIRDELKTKP